MGDTFSVSFILSWWLPSLSSCCVGRLKRSERNLGNLFHDRALKSKNCNYNKSIIYIEFLKNNNSKSILFPYCVCCELPGKWTPLVKQIWNYFVRIALCLFCRIQQTVIPSSYKPGKIRPFMDFLSHRALDNNLPISHNTLIGQVHSRFYSKQRRLVRSAVKFSLHLPSQITPPSPVNDADVFRPFSQELIWIGESCYPKIVVSGLILKTRSEDMLLEKKCISLSFQPSILFLIENHRRKSPKNGYLCMLIDSEVYSIVTYSLSEN